ncbi:ATP-binding protein [Malikia spinosa]|uniref:ATP-binding protein n=1 Tax=Malikia spinosa TaxID=86180 RepID=A0A2S9KHJ5_9BURK|nr:AAA family ATPase [Malikia spinosa]PRD69918.1 ATP-binding protein [Malikia spinosa]
MSKAGIQSNRGDGYQTFVALEWALTVLSDPEYQWLEVDSVTWTVDDVVIGKADGRKICCQCKKNQTAFKAWSIADLSDELHKAKSLLASDGTALVRFYSRNNFGDLAALREFSTSYADESAYQANLGIAHQETDTQLEKLLAQHSPKLSTYTFLSRTSFEVSPGLDRMQTLLHERLRRLASNPSAAYNALWTRLDCLGMRFNCNGHNSAAQHRLTKADLTDLLNQTGSMLTPSVDVMEVRASFQSTSAIGRIWRRDISNERIPSPLVNDILAAIAAKHRSILLTGLPGSGKTCVMLALQDELERLAQTRSDLLPLFIQSRDFADFATAQDRQAQGLSKQWVGKVARMAEDAHVVVVIDSLDVLSIAREHQVLTYFLAQIDQLLLIPNVTVTTACRDFDRHYNRRIAQRTWDKEFTCQPLNWETEITPLFVKLGIDASVTDAATCELIRNPRELALYVELAQQGGSFNEVTSQALAQRYLATVVQSNSALGDAAMQAIEAMASEMLRLRSLAVPKLRFSASQDTLRTLLSHNVLIEMQDGQLTFGHQTLLDVLVISRTERQGVSLNAFIQNLPPVPFVRPSIRSFIAQLATRDRREFRKQLRTVLTSTHAFHIRRLVAESFAEQIPQYDDWPLIRDLRATHREVFQVIYTQAIRPEWHYFWLKHLVPMLKDSRDVDGLTAHVHRVSQWKNDDAAGVVAFWVEVLTMEGVDKAQFVHPMAHGITQIYVNHSVALEPLLLILLKLPRQEHSFLGHALAHCMKICNLDDAVLWHYVAGEISDEDVLEYHFGKKLHCQPHEFGNSHDKFLADRMQKSTALLDMAIASVEQWSQIKQSRYGYTPAIYWSGFLYDTSYNDTHSQVDYRHVDGERILLDAVESAVVHHAITQSDWWQKNRKRLGSSAEGALRYFSILACTAAPASNLDVIGCLLREKPLLQSDLSYELGTLMQSSFAQLDDAAQDAIQALILSLHQEDADDPKYRSWMLKKQAQLILTIPCHLRSPASQEVLNECEKSFYPVDRQPDIGMRGGAVSAPFSFEVFLAASDNAVLRILAHYNGYDRNSFDDFLVGGEQEVGRQLHEAASRQPTRFLRLLQIHWAQLSNRFRNDIMDGAATYLAHRHGNLQSQNGWAPIEEPDAAALAQHILDELERHPAHWHYNRTASNALQACAHVVQNTMSAERLVFWAIDFLTFREQSSISGDSVDFLTIGINMTRGHVVESLMIMATRLHENNLTWPELLVPTLRQFAADEHPAIRALILRRLPYLQSIQPDLGWELFDLAMQECAAGLWARAEPCLYYAYHQKFVIVAPWLSRLYRDGQDTELETWGRISALAALSKKIDFSSFLSELISRNASQAWRGAASVWTHPGNMQQNRDQCLSGIQAGLSASNPDAAAVARKCRSLFREKTPLVSMPAELIQRCFTVLEAETQSTQREFYGFDAWLNATSTRDPMSALESTEIYLNYVRRVNLYLYDHENNLTQLLTRLFAQAEEQEESDGGAMLQRVVAVQDTLLALGVNGVNDWLKDAERP